MKRRWQGCVQSPREVQLAELCHVYTAVSCRTPVLEEGLTRHLNATLLSELQNISSFFTYLKNVFKLIFDLDHGLEIHHVNLSDSESNVYTYLETVFHRDHQHCQGPGANKLAWQGVAPLTDSVLM